jgi:hypothetical protein
MRRETKRFKEGEDQVRIVNKVYGQQIDRASTNFQAHKHELIKKIAENPEIALCDLNDFEVLKVYYDGFSWVAESQATVYANPYAR